MSKENQVSQPSRRDILKLGGLTAIMLKAGGIVAAYQMLEEVAGQTNKAEAQEILQQPPQELYALNRVPVTESEALALHELNGDSQAALLIEGVPIQETESGLTVGNMQLEEGSQLESQTNEALNFIDSYIKPTLSEGQTLDDVCGINFVFRNNEQELNEAAVLIDIRRNLIDVGGLNFSRGAMVQFSQEQGLHYMNPSDRVPESEIGLYEATPEFIASTQAAMEAGGYTGLYESIDYNQIGDWVLVETAQGRTVQLISQERAIFFDGQVLTGQANLNLRNAPTTVGSTVVVEGARLNDNPVVTPRTLLSTPEAELAEINVTPEMIQENVDNPNFNIESDGYNWTLIEFDGGMLWVAYSAAGDNLEFAPQPNGPATPPPAEFNSYSERLPSIDPNEFEPRIVGYGEGVNESIIRQMIPNGMNRNVRPLYFQEDIRATEVSPFAAGDFLYLAGFLVGVYNEDSTRRLIILEINHYDTGTRNYLAFAAASGSGGIISTINIRTPVPDNMEAMIRRTDEFATGFHFYDGWILDETQNQEISFLRNLPQGTEIATQFMITEDLIYNGPELVNRLTTGSQISSDMDLALGMPSGRLFHSTD
ncbi:hypothetical protein ACFL2V_19605 [Pseudomonadota bacterium]